MKNKYYQLSYPRSGANWLRVIACNLLNIPIDDTINSEYLKRHDFFSIKELFDENRHLVVIARNYKENIIRHTGGHELQAIKDVYMYSIKQYHEWKNPKLLIYYEDLITNPINEIKKLSEFMNIDEKATQNFIDNLQDYQENSINWYDTRHKSVTKGKHVIFHSNSLSVDQKNHWDSVMKSTYPDLYDKYLTRYKEKN